MKEGGVMDSKGVMDSENNWGCEKMVVNVKCT